MKSHAACLVCRGLVAGGFAMYLHIGVAVAEVVAVVSAKNPVSELSRRQTVDIFLAKARRFPDGTRAIPVDQVEGSPAREQFYRRFADKSPQQLKAHWSRIIFTGRGQPPKEVADGEEVKQRLHDDPNAIGYIEKSEVDGRVKVVLSE